MPPAALAGALEVARVKWDRLHLTTFAYTVSWWNGSPFGVPPARVVSLEGDIRVDGAPPTDGDLTPDGLFARVRLVMERATSVTYDAATGLPTSISAPGPAGSADADTNITVTDFVVSSPSPVAVDGRVAAAKRTWSRTKPTTFAYTWTRTAAGSGSPEASYAVSAEPGASAAFTPSQTTGGSPSSSIASVAATLDAAGAAATAGAWVDLSLEPHGVPLVVAVDPSPAAGDAYWIRLDFRDLEHEQAQAAYVAAQDRWSAAALQRFRYVWHYHGPAGTYTYRVTMRGDVSLLTRSKGSRVLWASMDYGPRLDVLFGAIGQELGNGGRVQATYDPTYGYSVKVVLTGASGNPDGTITISAFIVQ
jgi:hypothetical protein